MRHFIIASHSHLAEGMTSALELIVGKIENLNFYNAYIEEETGIMSILKKNNQEN